VENRIDKKKTDILVAGGGMAGCAAAVAAARRGHRVLLVEEGNCLGGTATSGGVSWFYAHLTGMGDIFEQIMDSLRGFDALDGHFFNGEYLKFVLQDHVEKAGVETLLHASVIDAGKRRGKITSVMISCCSRCIEFKADTFIDATGEGDLGALAGARFFKGHPDNGRTLHMTQVFFLQDSGRRVRPRLPSGLQPINSEEDLPGLHGYKILKDGRAYCTMTKVMGLDPTDPFELSRAEQEARRQMLRIVHYLQCSSLPSYTLCSSAAKIGIREGRRIIGEHVLTATDIIEGHARRFSDGITVASSQIDFHSLTQPGHIGWRKRVDPYPIPYRCLTPKGIRNLLVVGKCISADQVAFSSLRMIPTCCSLGQAAGTAAALALERKAEDIRSIDITALQSVLRRNGIELDPLKHRPFAPEITDNPENAL